MKNLQSVTRASVLGPIAAATTARTASIDTQGADYAAIVVSVGVELNTNSTNVVLNVKESDTDAATAYVTFSSSSSVTVDNTAAAVHTYAVDLKGRKRYLQISVTPDTTTNGTVATSVASELIKEVITSNPSNVTVL